MCGVERVSVQIAGQYGLLLIGRYETSLRETMEEVCGTRNYDQCSGVIVMRMFTRYPGFRTGARNWGEKTEKGYNRSSGSTGSSGTENYDKYWEVSRDVVR